LIDLSGLDRPITSEGTTPSELNLHDTMPLRSIARIEELTRSTAVARWWETGAAKKVLAALERLYEALRKFEARVRTWNVYCYSFQ
jgi:hypothetical protein